MIRQEKTDRTTRNLEVGQRVGDDENPEKKATGH